MDGGFCPRNRTNRRLSRRSRKRHVSKQSKCVWTGDGTKKLTFPFFSIQTQLRERRHESGAR
jgi:hypothetical protein